MLPINLLLRTNSHLHDPAKTFSCLQWQRTQKESCGKSSKEEKKIASFALTCSVYCIWLNPRSCINFEINTFFPLLKYKRLHQMEGHFVYLLINHKVLNLVPLTSIVGFKKKKKTAYSGQTIAKTKTCFSLCFIPEKTNVIRMKTDLVCPYFPWFASFGGN